MNWASGTPAVKSTPASLSPSTTSFAFSGFIFSPLLSKIPDYASHHPGYEIGARSAPYENLRDIRDFVVITVIRCSPDRGRMPYAPTFGFLLCAFASWRDTFRFGYDSNSLNQSLSPRWQRLRAAKQFVRLNDFMIARQFFDGLIVGVWQKRRRLFAGQLQILGEKFPICVNFSHCLAQNVRPIFRRAGRQYEG